MSGLPPHRRRPTRRDRHPARRFRQQHKDEIIGLARHEEAAEKGEHPLNRIMGIADTPEGLVIDTTDIHLPRRLGEAVKRAFHGNLAMHFDDAGYFVRVDWRAPG